MNKSESITKLATALSKAQAEMPPAKFNATNPFLKNKYANLGSIIEAAKPVLSAHGLSVVQATTSNNGDVGVTTALLHESGEWLEDSIYLPLGDEKGLKPAQIAGSIISYLRRYSYASILGMYADEDTDGNEPVKKDKPKSQSKDKPKPDPINGTRPYSPALVRTKIQSRLNAHKQFQPSAPQCNLLRHGLELCFQGDPEADDKRHTVLNYLSGYTSTTDVDGQYWKVLVEDFFKMKKLDDGSGEYEIDPMAAMEVKEIYGAALKEQGQSEMELATTGITR